MRRTVLTLLVLLLVPALLHGQDPEKLALEKKAFPKDEKAIFDLVNEERAKEKLPQLKLNAKLVETARKHAENMAKQEKMAHKLDGKTVGARATDAGYDYTVIGENLAQASGGDPTEPPTPEEIHKSWMASKGHRVNILQAKYRETGVAIVRNAKGNYYYAQVFGTQP